MKYIGQDVADRDCILFENMVDSGKSLNKMAQKLHENGARRIFWFSPHGLFTENCMKLIKNSHIEECIVTNTIGEIHPQNPKIHYISVAKLLAEAITVMHSNISLDKFRAGKNLFKYYHPPTGIAHT